jgi:hypothetical protein
MREELANRVFYVADLCYFVIKVIYGGIVSKATPKNADPF